MAIDYLPGDGPVARLIEDDIEFVGGPRNGDHEMRSDNPPWIGPYHRSLTCADDGAVRYIWNGQGWPWDVADRR